MAKKRKLNRRVAVLLAVMGGVVVLALAAYIFPKLTKPSSDALIAQADTALAEGRVADAKKSYGQALGLNPLKSDAKAKAGVLTKLAQMDFELSKASTVYTDRRELFQSALDSAEDAVRLDNSNLDAHKVLCDLRWAGVYVRDFVEAADALLKLDPKNDLTVYRKAVMEFRMRADASVDKIALAKSTVRDFETAISLNKKEPEYYVSYVQFLIELNDDSRRKPVDVLADGIKNNPKSGLLHVNYAALLARNDTKAASDYILGKALTDCPDDPTVLVQAARCYMEQKNDPKAQELIAKARKKDPTQADACQLEARQASSKGDFATAEKTLRDGVVEVEKAAKQQNLTALRLEQLERSRAALSAELMQTLLQDAASQKESSKRQPLLEEMRKLAGSFTPQQQVDVSGVLGIGLMLEMTDVSGAARMAKLKEATGLLARANQNAGGRNPTILNALISAYMEQRLSADAEKLVDEYLRQPGPFTPRALVLKGQFYRQRNELTNARDCFSKARELNPDDPDAQSQLVEVNVALGQPIPQGTQLTDKTIQALKNNAQWLLDRNETPAAIKLIKDLHQRQPDDTVLGLQLMQLYVLAQQMDEARKLSAELQAAAKPEDRARIAQYAGVLTETDPQKRYEQVLALYDGESKLPAFEKALLKANASAQAGKLDQYTRFIDEAAKLKPDDGRVMAAQFNLAVTQQKWADAQKLVDQAGKLNIDMADGKMLAAQLAMAQGQYDLAAQVIERDVLPKRDDNTVRSVLAQAYQNQGRLAKAVELYKSIVAKDPTNVPAIRALIQLMDGPATATEQEHWINEGYKLQPNDPVISEAHQSLVDKGRKVEDVIKDRLALAQKNPDDVSNMLRLAAYYEQAKQPQEAQKWYEKFMEKAPNKLLGASRLGGYYIRSNQPAKVAPLLEKLLAEPKADKVAVYVLWGDIESAMRNVEQAKTLYSKAITADPKDARGYYSLANICAAARDWPNACKNMQQVIALQPAQLYLPDGKTLVRMLINNSDQPGALKLLDQMLARNPADFEALQIKASIMMMQGKDDEALKFLDAAVAGNRTAPEPLVARGAFYAGSAKVRNLKKAEEDLQAARSLSERPEIVLELASFYQRQLEYDKAATLLEKIIVDHKDYEPAIQILVNLYMVQKNWSKVDLLLNNYKQQAADPLPILLLQDQMYRARQDKASRLAVLEEARKLRPDAEDVLQRYLVALAEEKEYDLLLKNLPQGGVVGREWVDLLRARGLVGLGNLKEGDPIFDAIVKSAGSGLLGMTLEQAKACYAPKDYPDRLQRWAQQRPQSWEIQYFQGMAALDARQYAAAEGYFKKGSELAPGNAEKSRMLMALSALYSKMYEDDRSKKARLTECIKALGDVLKIDPNNAIALNNLAYMNIEEAGNLQEGYDKARQAYDLAPNPQVLDTLGWAIAKMAQAKGDAQEKSRTFMDARQKLEVAVRLEPSAATCYHLGWVYEMTGQTTEATKLYRQARAMLDKDPSNPLLQTINDRIKALGA